MEIRVLTDSDMTDYLAVANAPHVLPHITRGVDVGVVTAELVTGDGMVRVGCFVQGELALCVALVPLLPDTWTAHFFSNPKFFGHLEHCAQHTLLFIKDKLNVAHIIGLTPKENTLALAFIRRIGFVQCAAIGGAILTTKEL